MLRDNTIAFQTLKVWKAIVLSLSNSQDPDGKLMFNVQGIDVEVTKKQFNYKEETCQQSTI